jgi:adenylate cyclase class 2
MTFEVEQKFHVDDLAALESRLAEIGAVEERREQHADSYYNHPDRDFAETREALRVRRIDGVPLITYKGTKLPGDIKARLEMEWRLDPGDPDGSRTEELLRILSFRRVGVVKKCRRHFAMPAERGDFGVMIDEVASLGLFAEIELTVDDASEIETARERIRQASQQLGLERAEARSYLSLVLALLGG